MTTLIRLAADVVVLLSQLGKVESEDLVGAVDVVVTKPGYGTFTEAACNGTPVLYQRRKDWPEQDCLIAWLQEYGRCQAIGEDELLRGFLETALAQVWQAPAPPPPTTSTSASASKLATSSAGTQV